MSKTHTKKEDSWFKPIILAVAIVFIVRTFIFSPFIVDGASMEPTLHDRERIIVSKTSNWIGDINRGDIIIIKGTKDNYVKRVIGLPGDVLEMKEDRLFINEKEVKEPYLKENQIVADKKGLLLTGDFGPLQIPEEHYFVMGDNRLDSGDSRNFLGYIDEKNIIGKSKFVFFPIKNMRITD
ncbi:signal peptidase I [Lederbergia lenta]|uniref:Signal peptidase I n=1 Tax=Lederbergia lenta TaxID=1467 RepID=A0A2X4VSE1_LEDLE|nr:signal peptidase I [Lederbergia lenta]MCM3112344.1 signal peptidase I [Lederbergia lenta]MEC2326564.1 signal peptidase I [Lederbergia lenta]SQI53169.1 signal peptidase I T [Lederbergia lenta]